MSSTFKDVFYSRHYLEESRYNRYIDIFKDYFQLLRTLPSSLVISSELEEEQVRKQIKKAIETLNREDRIIWYLRLLKFTHYLNIITQVNEINSVDDKKLITLPNYVASYLYKVFNKNSKELPAGIILGLSFVMNDVSRSLLTKLEHFFSLPIPDIQEYRFQNQKAKDFLNYFEELERKWKQEGGGREIDITNELKEGSIEQLLTFDNNKYGWFNLKKPACSKEGQSMGHCGNSPRAGSTDTILSFRSIKRFKNNVSAVPHLTFTVTKAGELIESKGRGNERPIEKYHPYIISILNYKSPETGNYFIKTIKGGGYMPQNNFHVNDLSVKDMLALNNVRPDLVKESDIITTTQTSLQKTGKIDKDTEELIKSKFYNMKENGYSHPAVIGMLLPLMLQQGNEVPNFIYDLFKEYTVHSPELKKRIIDLLQQYNKPVPKILQDT
jgi:hypothetical protein